MIDQGLSVGQVAELVGVSVRTLHHYEAVGLLVPARSNSGYRIYSSEDIDVLQQILTYRSLDFSLHQIQQILAAPRDDDYLEKQKYLLQEKIGELQSVLVAVQRMIEVKDMEISATEKAKAIYSQYSQEAQELYGHTDEWKQSQKYVDSLSHKQWDKLAQDAQEFELSCAQAKREGVLPGSAQAREIVQAHRTYLSKFFDCSLSQQVIIAKTYVNDERFRDYFEGFEPGLAQWIHDVVVAEATAQSVDCDNLQWK